MRIGFAVLVAAAVAATLWFVLSAPRYGPPPAPPTPAAAPETHTGTAAAPEPPEAESGVRPPAGACTIRGTVRRGETPAAARIAVRRLGAESDEERLSGGGSRPSWEGRADADGRFAAGGLPRGRYEVSAIADDGARAAACATVRESTLPAFVRLALGSARIHLRLVAVRSDGRLFRGEVGLVGFEDGFTGKELPREIHRRDHRTPGPDGRTVFRGLTPGLVRPLARVPGRWIAHGPLVRVPREGVLRFVVDDGLRRLPGRVVAAGDDLPVAGARLEAHGLAARAEPWGLIARAETDATGAFGLVVAEDTSAVSVLADGYAAARVEIGPETEELVVRLAAAEPGSGPCAIRGRVLDAAGGRPVAGAVVRAIGASGGRAVATPVTTDGEGRFAVPDVASTETLLYVHGGGWVSTLVARRGELPLEPLVVETPPGGAVERELTAVPAARARVTVLGPAGRPAAGVPVRHDWSWSVRRSPHLWRRIRFAERNLTVSTGPDGSCRFEDLFPESRASFRAEPPGGLPTQEWVDVPAGGATGEVVIRLMEGRVRIVAFVFADTREPVAGARLSAWMPGTSGVRGTWITDGDGVAEVGPFPDEELRVHLRHPDAAWSRDGFPIPGGPGPHVIEVERGLVFGGTVVGPDGAPAEGASVAVYGEWEGENYQRFGTVTDIDGRFLLSRVPAGKIARLTAWARRGEDVLTARTEDVRPGRLDHRLRLAPVPRREPEPELRVRVLGPDGKPVLTGLLRLHSGRDARSGRTPEQCGLREVVRHRFGWKGANRWWAEVVGAKRGSRRFAPKLVRLDGPAGEVTIRLEPAREIRGRVVDAAGDPVLGVPIRALSAAPDHPNPGFAPHADAASGERGEFRLRGLSAGPWRLRVDPPAGYATPEPVPVRGGATDVRIVLRAGALPLVTVLDDEGEPVPGLYLRIAKEGGGGTVVNPYLCRTDAEGRVRIEGLDPAKRYRLSISPGPRFLRKTIDPWNPRDTVIRLERAYEIAGEVRNGDGGAVRARVYWRRSGEEEWRWEWSWPEKGFRVERVPEGRYELKALPPDRRDPEDPAFPAVTVRAGEEAVTLELAAPR